MWTVYVDAIRSGVVPEAQADEWLDEIRRHVPALKAKIPFIDSEYSLCWLMVIDLPGVQFLWMYDLAR